MKFNRNKAYEIFSEFIKICNENKIWYSATNNTLLGTIRHGGFVPWFEKIQVMMTPQSYRKLLRLFPKRVIDSSIIDRYKGLQAAFVNDSSKWDVHTPFIEIFIVVPTTIKKVKKFKSLTINIKDKILFKKQNLRNSIDQLFDIQNEGFFLITNKKASVVKNWINNLSFETITKKFGPLDVQIIAEYESILENQYGKNYMEAIIPKIEFLFPAPGIKIKEKI